MRSSLPWILSGVTFAYAGAAPKEPPRDLGIVFEDDFESWTDEGPMRGARWIVRSNEVSRTRSVPGQVISDGNALPGNRVLEIACWTDGGESVGGLALLLGNYAQAAEGLGDGYEELYVRYYIKFDDEYRAVRNHGSNLGGRDFANPDAAWVGQSGIVDPALRGCFFSGLEPVGERGSRFLEMDFYSYHLDKSGRWGDRYDVPRVKVPIRVGAWHCVERRMKLNSVKPDARDPAIADGIEELWVDGIRVLRKDDVRFRRVEHLRITFFSLETYYHDLPPWYDADHPIKVYYDEVVIATEPIGPIAVSGSETERSHSP